MANSTTGFFGLRPVRYVDGSPYNGATMKCYIASGYAEPLYLGDAVMISDEAADVDALGKHMSIEKATIGDAGQILGVIVSFDPSDATSLVYNAASTERYCNICLAKDVVFQIKADGGGTPTGAWLGQNSEMVAGTDSTATGLSGDCLAGGTADSQDASNTVVVLGLSDIPGNELATYATWDVLINTPQLFNLGGATAAGRHLGVNQT